MLSPSSDRLVNIIGLTKTRHNSESQSSLDDKRGSFGGLGPYTAPFTIKSYSEASYAKPAVFKPLRIIRRFQLPLTFLDTATDEQYPPNGLFTACIDVLESNDDDAEQTTHASRVLIAQYESNCTLYVIERIQARVYSILRLAPWMKEAHIAEFHDLANTWSCPVHAALSTSNNTVEPWWQHAVVDTQRVERPIKRTRMSMVRRSEESVHIKIEHRQDSDHVTTASVELQGTIAPEPPQEPAIHIPTAQQQLESLVQQYLDAVYTSKTSLAYFAKGPITRIRNAFVSPDETAPPTHELVMFLRSMLLSPKASEKKYHEKLPAIIRSMPVGLVSDEEVVTKSSKTKRSKKQAKLSRDGLYPLEEPFIKKWWTSDMPNAENAGQETIETRIRRRIGDLRVRETLAQMILMLEIIALESLATYKGPSNVVPAADDLQAQPKKHKKKLDNIPLQLDLLLDRLSIWHAVEEVGILDFDNQTAKQQQSGDGNGKGGNDRLHGFCVEVIVPFYMSRLPEQAVAINKKLGGPAIATSKRKAMRPPLTSNKTGEKKESEKKKSRRSLARVATDTTGKTGDRHTPSLARSATDTALLRQQSVKRETSEAPLSAIPFQRSPSRARQSMSQLRHLQGREMDLTITSAAAAAKLKHKARVEDDLKEAIATLKKPNRDLVAGSYMAEIEKRALGSATRSRKPANPVRKVVKDIQVTATPRAARRTKNVIEQTPVRYHEDPFVRPTVTEGGPLGEFCIPSSAVRQPSSIVPGTTQRSVTARELAQPGVAETPSKAPTTKLFSSGAARRTIFATPVKSSARLFDVDAHPTADIFETPVKAGGSTPSLDRVALPPIVAATPIKPAASTAEGVPVAFAGPLKDAGEPSIYDALGWNDDDDFV